MYLYGLTGVLTGVFNNSVRKITDFFGSAYGKVAAFLALTSGAYMAAQNLVKEAMVEVYDLAEMNGLGVSNVGDLATDTQGKLQSFLDVVNSYPLAKYALDCLAVDVLGEICIYMMLPLAMTVAFMIFSFLLSMIYRIKWVLKFW